MVRFLKEVLGNKSPPEWTDGTPTCFNVFFRGQQWEVRHPEGTSGWLLLSRQTSPCAREKMIYAPGGWFHCRRRQNERYGIAHASLLKTKTVCEMKQSCCLPFSPLSLHKGRRMLRTGQRVTASVVVSSAGMPLHPRGGGIVVESWIMHKAHMIQCGGCDVTGWHWEYTITTPSYHIDNIFISTSYFFYYLFSSPYIVSNVTP